MTGGWSRRFAAALGVPALLADRGGTVAVVMAFMAVPVIGAVGAAIDYQRIITARQFLQAELDAAAVGSAGAGREDDSGRWLERVRGLAGARFGAGGWPATLELTGSWRSDELYLAEATAAVDLTFLRVLPGLPDAIEVAVASLARVQLPVLVYEEPELAELDPEAGDYNRISAYCFDHVAARRPGESGRSQLTVIADNAGTAYDFTMPRCAAGEVMSYQLLNVRMARTQPDLWDDPLREHYLYHTDTVILNEVERHDLGGWNILETVLCDSLEQCRPRSEGGIIPEGKNRVAERARHACAPGKYMYYGWEDRPPGRGWTDRDYDDIRLVVGCPVERLEGEKRVSLVR